jgi:hypothetical protein
VLVLDPFPAAGRRVEDENEDEDEDDYRDPKGAFRLLHTRRSR